MLPVTWALLGGLATVLATVIGTTLGVAIPMGRSLAQLDVATQRIEYIMERQELLTRKYEEIVNRLSRLEGRLEIRQP
jgi:uncharacterized coiled-coil DUF342 family protein